MMLRLVTFGLVSAFFFSCSSSDDYLNKEVGRAFGTTFQINYYTQGEPVVYAMDFRRVLDEVNVLFSNYDKSSVVSKINNNYKAIQIPDEFRQFWKRSKELSTFTEGYFDPSIGHLINQYGFGEQTEATLDTTNWRKHVGIDSIEFVGKYYQKKSPKLKLNFNANAKGYALDKIAEFLNGVGVSNYLIEIGGEVRVRGRNIRKDSPWKIGLDSPNENELSRKVFTVFELKDESLATSGNYRKYQLDSLGNYRVHTINPLTGKARKTDLLSASVFAKDCATADGLATAFMAMGYEKAREFSRENKVEVYFIYIKNDKVDVYMSPSVGRKTVK